MAKKRAPGAGRKPSGEFQGKSAVLTTRITPETRAALERAAAKGKRSLSQEAEYGLRWYLLILKRTPERGNHIRALGEAVVLVAQYIERATEQKWNEDAFTGEAVRHGCTSLIAHFAPRGTPVKPSLIKEAAMRLPNKTYSDPEGVGITEAGKVISSIESWNFSNFSPTFEQVASAARTTGAYLPDEWYRHEQLFRDLGSGWKRAQARKKQR